MHKSEYSGETGLRGMLPCGNEGQTGCPEKAVLPRIASDWHFIESNAESNTESTGKCQRPIVFLRHPKDCVSFMLDFILFFILHTNRPAGAGGRAAARPPVENGGEGSPVRCGRGKLGIQSLFSHQLEVYDSPAADGRQ